MSELAYLSAVEATRCFSEKTLSPVELMRAVSERCEVVNPAVNAFTFTFFERALAAAKDAEDRYFNGEALGDLDGVPLVVKDSTNVRGEISSKGSRLFADHRPQKTDPSLRRLLDAGAIMIARSTMPEFGEIERGVKSPTLQTVAALAEALGMNPSDLMRMAEEGASKSTPHEN